MSGAPLWEGLMQEVQKKAIDGEGEKILKYKKKIEINCMVL